RRARALDSIQLTVLGDDGRVRVVQRLAATADLDQVGVFDRLIDRPLQRALHHLRVRGADLEAASAPLLRLGRFRCGFTLGPGGSRRLLRRFRPRFLLRARPSGHGMLASVQVRTTIASAGTRATAAIAIDPPAIPKGGIPAETSRNGKALEIAAHD